MHAAFEKFLSTQLSGHLKVHLGKHEMPPLRLLDTVQKPAKKSPPSSHIFETIAKLEVYSSTCGRVARTGIEDLKRSGSLLLVRSSGGEPFHVELAGSGKRLAITRVSSGRTAKDMEKALARERFRVRDKKSELRVLRIPGMHFSAVWLHHRTSSRLLADLFIPYTHNFTGLQVGRTYTRARIERTLKQYATQMILRWYEGYEKTVTQSKASDFPNRKDRVPGTSSHPMPSPTNASSDR